jgi:hypothetical protein
MTIAVVATATSLLIVVLATRGQLVVLGDMYAFGLLGAFVLDSVSLDVIRWRLGRRGPMFWLGILTTGMVVVAWVVNSRRPNARAWSWGRSGPCRTAPRTPSPGPRTRSASTGSWSASVDEVPFIISCAATS